MPIVVPYTKQVWVDNNGANPVSAARMGVLEEGILDVSQAPAVRVFHNTTQSITSALQTVLAFNSERYDQAAGAASTQHDTVTNNSRLTCLYAGIYKITGHIEFAANATGLRLVNIQLNGTTEIARQETLNLGGADPCSLTVTSDYALAVNDYVQLRAYQSSGGALNVTVSANFSPEFMMVRVG
jgi:hypothetical protein